MSARYTTLHDGERPSVVIRELLSEAPLLVLSARLAALLADECGSPASAIGYLRLLATEFQRVIGLHALNGQEITYYIGPDDWSHSKLLGYLGAFGDEIEAVFGPVRDFIIPTSTVGSGAA